MKEMIKCKDCRYYKDTQCTHEWCQRMLNFDDSVGVGYVPDAMRFYLRSIDINFLGNSFEFGAVVGENFGCIHSKKKEGN